jgi:hypothetical protein
MSSKAEKFYQQHLKKKGIHARMSRNAQDRDDNSLRNRLSVQWETKESVIEQIREKFLCSRPEADKKFETAPRNGVIVHKSGLWATAVYAEHNDPPKPRAIRTPRQQEQWDQWSFVPDLANDKDAEKSELFRHQISAGIFPDIATAKAEYHRAVNGSRVDELKPTCVIRLDGRKVVHGKNYYRPGTFRWMKELKWDEAVEACRLRYAELIAVSENKMTGFEPEKLLGQAIACGDLVAIHESLDPFDANGLKSFTLIGADKLAKLEAARLAEEARVTEIKERSAKLKARRTDFDTRTMDATVNHTGFEIFMNQVFDYAQERGIQFYGVHRILSMPLFQNFFEMEIALPGIDLRRVTGAVSDAKYSSDRERHFIEFMVECGILVQVTERDEKYNCDRVAYHGAVLTFEEAKALRDDLKAEAADQRKLVEQLAQLPKAA